MTKTSSKSPLHQPLAHDSAYLYVTGAAQFIDDRDMPKGTLSVALGLSDIAHGKIEVLDLSEVETSEGVITILTSKDIPGKNDASPIMGDDPIFADETISYHGQALFAVVARSAKLARMAALKAKIDISELPAIITLDKAIAQKHYLAPAKKLQKGNAKVALSDAAHRLSGTFNIGGQEHFYLEGQAAFAMPGEAGDLLVHASTQHPTEIQHKIAEALGLSYHDVTVDVRRMGGAFGGKESQANMPAIIASLAALKTKRPVRFILDRDEDMRVTGKRHDFKITYEVGFDEAGRISALSVHQALRCGMSFDLSAAIAGRAMMHAENCYDIEHVEITSQMYKTHTPSNTAFRGFGGPQGMLGMERIIDDIAAYLKTDPLRIRQQNYYADKEQKHTNQLTPYHQPVTDCIIGALTEKLVKTSDYHARRAQIEDYNHASPYLKKGLALTPVKFGISFNNTMLNQAGALVHVYTDGSVHLNHGGTEMGQGLFTKIRQICAHGFGIGAADVKITATSTGKVPNTSATAASSGTDLNGMAVAKAVNALKERMASHLAGLHQTPIEEVRFSDGQVHIGKTKMSFAQAAHNCWQARISLSATGFYATPDIHWDEATAKGSPFYYFAYGAAVSEVIIDCFTGEMKILRVDILHDCGTSLNPAIDKGQIEGGFVQGMGWLTNEELVYDDKGKLQTHAPSTYKIPACSDRPKQLHIDLYESGGNPSDTIYRSKAVGEPPIMLAMSVHSAIRQALQSQGDNVVDLQAPATAEEILRHSSVMMR